MKLHKYPDELFQNLQHLKVPTTLKIDKVIYLLLTHIRLNLYTYFHKDNRWPISKLKVWRQVIQ
jgi:hypothetical protein